MYDVLSVMPRDLVDLRDQYLDRYHGQNLEGLAISRVEDFFAANNLEVQPYLLVGPDDIETVHGMDTIGVMDGTFDGVGEGVFCPELELSFILRNPALEAQNGPAYTEGLIVHEGAHSDTVPTWAPNPDGDGDRVVRSGFVVPGDKEYPGWLPEEGWADFHRGNYMGQHFGSGSLAGVAKMFGYKNPQHTLTIRKTEGDIPLPFKYFKLNELGEPAALRSALAGFAIELLVQADPEIYAAMRAGRSTAEPEELRDKTNALHPNLYQDLRRYDYSVEDFTKGLFTVIRSVYGSVDNVVRY